MKKSQLKIQNIFFGPFRPHVWVGIMATFLWTTSVPAAVPADPLVELRFNEGIDTISTNQGVLGGEATFATVTPNTPPYFTNNVPTGTYVPANNSYAVAMEEIGGNTGGRAIDLVTTNVNYAGVVGTLGTDFPGLTICLWLNARTLQAGPGGNRIAECFEIPGQNGFDFVHNAAGQLCLSINQYPDNLPTSVGAITAEANLASTNWMFVAVTWDPTLTSDQVKYYFGNAERLAWLDSSQTYAPPALTPNLDYTGLLTVGNFVAAIAARNTIGSNSRQFRGLLDEVRVYTNALTIQEIQQAQLNSAVPPTPVTINSQPAATATVHSGQTPTLSVLATGAAIITYQWQTNNVNVPGATNSQFTLPEVTLDDDGMTVRVLVDNDATPDPGIPSSATTITVVPENYHKVAVSFSEGTGTTTANQGNLSGYGKFQVNNGYPTFSSKVPVGAFAPSASYNRASLDMGIVYAGQGNRAVDFTNQFGAPATGTLGRLTALTICGWLNSAHTNAGSGGNRIVYALDFIGGLGAGFDLVHLNDGSLQLGVNQYPNGMPTSSPGKITSDPDGGNANWVFFAVTYDSTAATDPVKFYFGKPDALVTFDSAITYPNSRGVIYPSGALTIGNFGPAIAARTATGTGSSGTRIFRGLLDEIQIWNRALTLEEIQAAQLAPSLPPLLLLSPQAPNVILSWETVSNFQLQSRTNLSVGGWHDVTNDPVVSGNVHTVTLPANQTGEFFRLSPHN